MMMKVNDGHMIRLVTGLTAAVLCVCRLNREAARRLQTSRQPQNNQAVAKQRWIHSVRRGTGRPFLIGRQ